MTFHLPFLILALALFPRAHQLATALDLTAQGDNNGTGWAKATVYFLGRSANFTDQAEISSLSDIWNLPPGLLFCNKTTDTTINHDYVSSLVSTLYASKASAALLRAKTGEIWRIAHKSGGIWVGTQIYICNFGKYDIPFSVAEYDIINDILNDHCGDMGGWVRFMEWQTWVGRDATNDDGSFRWACGNSPPPQGQRTM